MTIRAKKNDGEKVMNFNCLANKPTLHIVTMSMALAVSAQAFGGGLYITEFGQPNMGTSGAGWSVLAEDASTAVGNPAGMFWLEKDSEWMVTAL